MQKLLLCPRCNCGWYTQEDVDACCITGKELADLKFKITCLETKLARAEYEKAALKKALRIAYFALTEEAWAIGWNVDRINEIWEGNYDAANS